MSAGDDQVAEASSRRAQSWGAFSKAGAAVHSSGASVSNLTELMHKGRNIVKVCEMPFSWWLCDVPDVLLKLHRCKSYNEVLLAERVWCAAVHLQCLQ